MIPIRSQTNLVPQRLIISVPKKSISEIPEVLQQERRGSQTNILENVQMSTERGYLETASLRLWNLQKYKE